jgi:hypothetical protein
MNQFQIGDKVTAEVTKNGYFHDIYRGVVVGFTKNGRIKVKTWRGVRMHVAHHVSAARPNINLPETL